MVVKARLSPVIEDHGNVEIVRANAAASCCLVVVFPNTGFDVVAGTNQVNIALAQCNWSTTRRAAEAFLQAHRHGVETPVIRVERVTAN